MNALKLYVLFALSLGLLALLGVVGAAGTVGKGAPDALPMASLTEGLVGHWSFDVVSDTTAIDTSGLSNDGTLMNGPSYTTVVPSLSVPNPYALEFDGVNDWVEVNGVADDVPVGSAPWSASLWMKAPELPPSPDQAGLLAVNTSGGGNVVLLLLRDHAFTVFDAGGGQWEASSTTPIDDDRWHHLAYTSDGGEGTLYVDGWAEVTHTVSYDFATSNQWSLGQEYDGATRSDFYTGLMDEVRVYTRTLSALEVAELAVWIPITHHVDADAAGAGSGLSWTDAFAELQSALALARPGDQVWVAEGVYYPDYSPALGAHTGWVTATFALRREVALYGGFDPGSGVETPDQRDPAAHVTVLSGDIDGDDVTDPFGVVTDTVNISGTNSYHVVTGSGVTETAVLDGFTVTGGNADGIWASPCGQRCGGGMYNDGGSPTLTGVTFSGNTATYNGGGMYNYSSSPALTDVIFSGNTTTYYGGGMFNLSSSPTLSDVTFSGNIAADAGGGMCNVSSSSPTLTDVTFSGNEADYGGGMVNSDSSPTLTDVTFSGNIAADDGGGMCNVISSSPALTDVTLSGNTANRGGGMVNESSSPRLTDVTFSGNTANFFGGGMVNAASSSPALTDVTLSGNTANWGGGMYNASSSPALTNVTLSGNTADYGGGMYNISGSSPALTHCTVTGNTADLDGDGFGGGGGIYQDGLSAQLKNTIVAGNDLGTGSAASGPDLWGTFSSLSYNLIGNADDATFVPATGDQVGSSAAPLDPLLAGLALNPPGSTATHALLEGSPALDWIPYGANGCGSEVTADQRGAARPFPAGGACDVGAYEVSSYVVCLPLVLRNLSAQ